MPNQITATTTDTTTEPTQTTSKRYRCRHIFIDGHRCGSPSLRGEPFCYYHHSSRGFADEKRLRRTWAEFELPPIEDRSSVLAAINEVLQRIAGNQIAAKDAGLLLYGLQIASLNLPEPGEAKSDSGDANLKEQPVEEVIPTPPYGDLAPVAEFVEAANPTHAPHPISNPEPAILPSLNASAALNAPQTQDLIATPQKHIISTGGRGPRRVHLLAGVQGGAFAAVAERPLYFALPSPNSPTPATNPPLPVKPEINIANPAPAPSAWYPNNCHAYEKRTSRPPHSAHRHQAAQRRRSRRRHELHGLQLA